MIFFILFLTMYNEFLGIKSILAKKQFKKQNSYSKSKNVQTMPKKLKIFSLQMHKGAGIFKKTTQNLSK